MNSAKSHIHRTVLSLRTPTTKDDPYITGLSSPTQKVFSVQVLDTEFVNLEHLRTALDRNWAGLVVTSKRGIEAMEKTLDGNTSIKLKNTIIYTLCNSAKDILIARLGVQEHQLIGLDTVDAEELSQIIVEHHRRHRQTTGDGTELLLLQGNKSLPTIPDALTEAGISFTPLQVYQTSIHPRFANTILSLSIPKDSAVIVVFFSPSCVQYTLSTLQKTPWWSNSKLVAIGKTTAKTMIETGLSVDAICETPDVDGLRKAIEVIDGNVNR